MNSSIALAESCIKKINQQINMEFNAFYAYQALANHFSSPAVAMFNVGKRFAKMAQEEIEHADALKNYLITRGAVVQFFDIKAPSLPANISLLQAFELALSMEQAVNRSLIELDNLAGECNEAHLATYIEDEFLAEQIKGEAELNGFIAQIKRAGTGLGEYLFDRALAD